MNLATARALNSINRAFYRSQAAAFSATREHPWPGWERVLRGAAAGASGPRVLRVLDVGCGNGRLAAFLAERAQAPLAYLGLDASRLLLAAARRAAGVPRSARFVAAELVEGPLPLAHAAGPRFDLIAVFGFLHHVPGFARRRALLAQLAARLAPRGRLALAFWRFASEGRFARRRLAWESWNARGGAVDAAELEAGDALLRFGETGGAVRYCHFADGVEIERLLAGLRLRLTDGFCADGREGRLNDYRVLEATEDDAA